MKEKLSSAQRGRATEPDVRITQLARQACSRPRVRKTKAEDRVGETRYRKLFNSIDEGFCIVEMKFEGDVAVDYRFLEVNPAFHKHTGLDDVDGKWVTELLPGHEAFWFEIYGRIAKTGEPARFVNPAKVLDRVYDLYAFRVDDPEEHHVAILFSDITVRRRQEENLAFLADIAGELSRLSTVDEIMQTVGRKIGAYLKINTCSFIDVDESNHELTVTHSWTEAGAPDQLRTYPISDDPLDEFVKANREGKTSIVRNMTTDPRTQRANPEESGVYAFVTVPFHRDGEWKHMLSMTDSIPRDWREDEVELFQQLTDRVFPRLDRARAEAAVAADYRDIELLREIGARLVSETEVQSLYDEVNVASIKLTNADAGAVQIYDADTQKLVLISSEGFPPEAKERFLYRDRDSATSCGSALTSGARRFVDFDDPTMPDPQGDLRWILSAGYRSGQSTPLITRSGKLIGMLSNYWRQKHRPAERELRYVDLLARQVADLIEQRQAEKKVAESEERLRTLFDSMSEAFVVKEAIMNESGQVVDFRFIECNPAFTKQMGLGDPRGHTVRELKPDIDPLWMERYKQVLKTGKPTQFEARIAPLDRWFTASVSRIGGKRSNRLAIVLTNITGLKRAEAALRDSKHHLQLVLESVRDYGIITLDAKGIITGWNSGAVSIFGFSEEEAIDRHCSIIFTPEDNLANIPRAEMRIAAATGHASDERWHIGKDGVRFWVSGVMSPLVDGDKVTGYVKVARDLTEWRKAEAALRDSETRFRTLSDAVPQVVWTNDAAGEANYFNQRWFDYTGLSYRQSAGPGWQVVVHPDDASAAMERWATAVAMSDIFDTEFRLRRADGEYRWFIGRNVPLRDDSGKVVGWFGTATDIEDLKKAERDLKLAHNQLESRVAERTLELSAALDRLRSESAERAKLEGARRELLRRVVTLQEEERRRISRELHDNLGQHMVAVKLELDALRRDIGKWDETSREKGFENLSRSLDLLIKAAHRQAWELRPAELDHFGLDVALKRYIDEWSGRTGIEVDFQTECWNQHRPSSDVEIAFYRVVQEALTNVARHAQATKVTVVLELGAQSSLTIEDNGRGFDPSVVVRRLGLLGMRERLALVGGELKIMSAPCGGTKVEAHAGSGIM
jgi:PAS domain S-box-containing protein